MINPQWLELPRSRTNFHGSKDVRAIEVRLYHDSTVKYKTKCSVYLIQNVEGEVYDVDEECLSDLDKFEHHPEFYTRQPTEVILFKDPLNESQERRITCNAYFLVHYRDHLLNLPMYSCYYDNIDGKKFELPADKRPSSLPLHEIHKGYENPDC